MTKYQKGQRLKVWDIRYAKKGVVKQIDVLVLVDSDESPYISTARGATGHVDIGVAGLFFSDEGEAWNTALAGLIADVQMARRQLDTAIRRQNGLIRARQQRDKQQEELK